MPKPRLNKLSQKELAALVGITPATLRKWRDEEGLNLADVEAVKRRAAAVVSKDESLAEARRRKAVAAADAEEIRVQRLKGELVETHIPRAVIEQLDHAIGMVWKQTPNELTGILDGLSGGKMRDAIRDFVDHTLIPRFSQQVATGLADIEVSITQLAKILPPQNP